MAKANFITIFSLNVVGNKMKYIQTIIITLICSSALAQSNDTINFNINCKFYGAYQGYQYNKLSSDLNNELLNQNFQRDVQPFYDTLFSAIDSTSFNGLLMVNCDWLAADSSTHISKWTYYVKNGFVFKVLGVLDNYLRDSILVGHQNVRTETRYRFDKNHNIIEVENYQNCQIHGYQYNKAFDSLRIEFSYQNDTMTEILNSNIIYIDNNMNVISKKDFINLSGPPYCEFSNWDLEELSIEEVLSFPEYRMIMYIREIPNEFEPKKNRHRKKIFKQLPTTKPKLH